MSFAKQPLVDKNALQSEKSVRAVMSLLSLENGFISRTETPDYGVDLDVELVDESGATSRKFAVQIKSAASVRFVEQDGQQFVTLPFDTSRLGYLCRRSPASGIIVLYDAAEQVCYFDYVEALVYRLEGREATREWREQKQVTLHLTKQILDEEALRSLHNQVSHTYQQHHRLVRQYGGQYGLTSFAPEVSDKSTPLPNPNDPDQLAAWLEIYGGLLFNLGDYRMLLDMLNRLPPRTIGASKRLLFLAALANTHTGVLIEAEYFLRKCAAEEYDEAEQDLLAFSRIALALAKGEASRSTVLDELASLKQRTTSSINTLTFSLNIIYLSLVNSWYVENAGPMLTSIKDLFREIDDAPIELREKHLLTVYNCENLCILLSTTFSRDATYAKIRAELGAPLAHSVQLDRARATAEIITAITDRSKAAATYAYNHKDEVLLAYAVRLDATLFLDIQHTQLLLTANEQLSLTPQERDTFSQVTSRCANAHGIFVKHQLPKAAHQALGLVYELDALCRAVYRQALLTQPPEELLEQLAQLEKQTGIAPFKPTVQQSYQQTKALLTKSEDDLAHQSDESLAEFAVRYLEVLGLPVDRLPNLLAEMQASRLFQQECENSLLELLSDQGHPAQNLSAYTQPTSYKIRNKVTGFTTPASSDVSKLLEQYRVMVKNWK
ncbi:DUF4365 domain-containing protein [Hymenobacter psoromatis]|uniref:DUF4365 domain-containing protein n=3 Tax=Hymenobacter psoromatis TaxID=1484116 RepID=UPI001CC14D74|nr:DUF4365 domain-containing protein [Hymenobacter psoromatis]